MKLNAEQVANGLWRLPLPSQTLPPYDHSNSYLIADNDVAVLVDAGSNKPESLELIQHLMNAQGIRLLKAVLLTHSHQDHCAGLNLVQEKFDTPAFIHPNEYERLKERTNGDVQALNDNRVITVGDKTIRALFTPGHSPGHLSFYLEEKIVIAGDLLAAQGSTWVGLPEGDVDDYLQSLEILRSLKLVKIAAGHGDIISEPYNRLNEVRKHRLARVQQVLEALADDTLSLEALRETIYPDVPEQVQKLAEASLLAILKKLMREMKILHLGEDVQGPYTSRR